MRKKNPEVRTSRKDAGVHECGHTEIGQCEEEDHNIIERNGGGEPLWQPRTPAQRRLSSHLQKKPDILNSCMNVFRFYSRETEKQRRGPHEKGGGCGHRHIATGAEWAGWGGVSESPAHTETHRHLEE